MYICAECGIMITFPQRNGKFRHSEENKMKNIMIKSNGAYITFPANKAEEAKKLMSTITTDFELFNVSQMPLKALPTEIQDKVKAILRAYNEVNVTFEHGEFRASASYGIKSSYGHDYFVCGYYKQEDVYTKEERKQNFFEEFGYFPCYM